MNISALVKNKDYFEKIAISTRGSETGVSKRE